MTECFSRVGCGSGTVWITSAHTSATPKLMHMCKQGDKIRAFIYIAHFIHGGSSNCFTNCIIDRFLKKIVKPEQGQELSYKQQ